ncbi:hypothetical protein DAPPUDRAFT_250083 [Daphnia pulex]|uniref:BTB domain-containing protein n=1 Tax=Daphnia pulex TaxID=6669 RepID=E9GXW0_DAPPU|nr:hypothetical protein DAPPUDRAFT_250083 [Daphnia pulex]|eukprot:EFX75745.1 hypothetical protein DAPPUDRAFT_250083 [Daphnia pulex]
MEGMTVRGEGEVTVDEVRFELFRVLWKYSKYDESVKYCQKFRLGGMKFDSEFQISRKKESIGKFIITLKYISCSDRFASQPGDEQSKSKRIELEEEESVGRKLKSHLPPVTIFLSGQEDLITEYKTGKWKFNRVQTVVGGLYPFFEFWIDFGTNELEDKIIVLRMGNILHNQTLCDVKFKFTNGEEIGAHAAILSSASSVFAAMLRTDFVESKTRIVNIADSDMDVFKEMLTYMYTGKAPNMEKKKFARSVYEVAHKYDIELLKNDCVNLLTTQLSNSNAMELLVWAQFHSLPNPIEKSEQFIAKNSQELCSQPAWLDFMKDHPQLCLKIIQRMARLL